jgi:hypothetical protein
MYNFCRYTIFFIDVFDFKINKLVWVPQACFESIQAIQAVVTTALNEVPVEAFEGAYRAWESRWEKCVDAHGQYFEEY